jgi:tetratricopeptide (TPR) repeat protein
MMDDNSARLFLSYSLADKPTARKIHQSLISEGFDVWFDEASAIPGAPWYAEVGNGIATSQTIVLLIGLHTPEPWQKFELESIVGRLARDENLLVLPVLLPRSGYDNIPSALRNYKPIDVRDENDEAVLMSRILTAVRAASKPGGQAKVTVPDLETAASMSTLASKMTAAGDFSGALQLQQKVVDTCKRLLGEEDLNTLTATNNLVGALYDSGNIFRAQELQEQLLRTLRDTRGEDDPHTLTAVNNLAAMIYERGDFKRAVRLQERVLASRLGALGPTHSDTITAMSNLALCQKGIGDLVRARALQDEVVVYLARSLGDDHPDSITARNNLAGILMAQGDLPKARQIQERVFETWSRLLGSDHPNTLTAMNNLAGILKAQGDLSAARTLLERVLTGRRRVLGENHPDTTGALNNLSRTAYAQKELAGIHSHQNVKPLIFDRGDGKYVNIVMMGATGSGKTCYILAMYAAMSSSRQGFTFTSPDLDADLELTNLWEELKNGNWPSGTAFEKVWPFDVSFGFKPIMQCNWLDYRGGLLRGEVTDNERTRFEDALGNASCVILCVAGDQLAVYVDHSAEPEGVRRFNAEMNSYYRRFGKTIPVVVAITKADQCPEAKLTLGIERLRKELLSSFFVKGCDWFVMFCPVSLGMDLDRASNPEVEGKIKPFNVHLPAIYAIYCKLSLSGKTHDSVNKNPSGGLAIESQGPIPFIKNLIKSKGNKSGAMLRQEEWSRLNLENIKRCTHALSLELKQSNAFVYFDGFPEKFQQDQEPPHE